MLYDLDDLDQSILHFTEAIFLPLPWNGYCLNFIQIFFAITLALVHRANESRQPEDVTHAIIYLRYLRGQSLEAFNIPPNRVTGLLVEALGVQVEMELGDVRQDIEEMTVLCHELLKSDIPTTSVTGFIMVLVRVVRGGQWGEPQGPSHKVMECLQEANKRLPGSYEVSIALARSLFKRCLTADSNDDYEEAVTILDKVIHAPGDTRLTKHQEEALWLAHTFALTRFYAIGRPEHLEEAINRTRALLGEALPEHTRHFLMNDLAGLRRYRFIVPMAGVAGCLQDAHLGSSDGSDHPSLQDLAASLTELNVDQDADNHEELLNANLHLDLMISIIRITDEAEVEEATKYCRRLLGSSHNDGRIAHFARTALDQLLACTNNIEDLDETISIFHDKLLDNSNSLGVPRFYQILKLITCLSARFLQLRRSEDLNEIMQLYPRAVNDESARTPDRFLLSREWANIAHFLGHPSTSAAYDCAISLMQDTLTFAPTLDIQHTRLVAMRDRYENLPLDHASYHVSAGQLRQVIETLERGRGLIWSEMRGFRTSIDQIRATDLHLADGFTAVNRDLETLTSTISSNSNDDDGGFVRMDPFGRLVVKQRKLLDDRYKLILQIQALPGLETFLKSPSFDNLHFAAARGPVIIINHCRWRSDILILLHSCSPSLIPTADDFYGRANNLWDQLLGARKEGLDSNQYEDTLCSVLKELYELVGRPVIQRLQELRVPEQSRVWWCPTSVFCSLPLHAMGPIPSDDGFGSPQYFLDLYIPSYTPTLSTLIESNNSGSNTSNKPSILLISQPDASLPGARGEMRAVQATNTQVTTLSSSMATPTTVLERLRDHRFAHIACHGILELGKPFDASFKLYRDKRLSLLDIVRSQLPEAEFAFLSACHTAELTEESIADEALHLAAAMQYCGFRSVVGTMWAMVDGDGRDLARNFYKQVFSGRKQGERYYVRTAEALRDAVKELRRKRGMTLERWVNFVHYGA
jgi:CHAT domain-containing protein/tetratricopeptide (TPR) repeat protein